MMHSIERSSRTHQPKEADIAKEKPYNYFAQQLYLMSYQMAPETGICSSRRSSSPSHHNAQDNSHPARKEASVISNVNVNSVSTSTPKRRRKEDGNDSSIRFSPDKRIIDTTMMSSPMSPPLGASLLDDEDELSQLIGTSIPHPAAQWKKKSRTPFLPKGNALDELSYSESEGEESLCSNINNKLKEDTPVPPSVARDLSNEFMWEKMEEEEDDIDIDGGCKIKTKLVSPPTPQPKEKVVVFEGPMMTTMKSPTRRKASPKNVDNRSPNARNNLEPAAAVVGTTTSNSRRRRRKKSRQPPPISQLSRRLVSQVSVCSELTMEDAILSETSYHSGGTYSSDELNSTSSSDTRDEHSQWYGSSASDDGSVDSGVMSHHNMEPYALRRDSPRRRREHQMDKAGHWMYDNRQQSSTCRRSLHPVIQHHHHKQPHRSRSSKKRKGRHHTTNNHQVDHHRSSRSSSHLFPLSHLTESFKSKSADENDSLERSGSGSKHRKGAAETSLLMDLSHELQEMVVIAGNSGGQLVASLFHQLCEE